MEDYIINLFEIEELQMINNRKQLDAIFTRAKSTIVNGAKVILLRRHPDGRSDQFDSFTTLEDLSAYRKSVYKYL